MSEGSSLAVEGGIVPSVMPDSGSKLSPNAEMNGKPESEDQVMADVDHAAPAVNGMYRSLFDS